MDRLGPSIYWLLMLIGGTEGPVLIRTELVALVGILTVFLYRGVFPPMSFQFSTVGSLSTSSALRAAPVTIYLWRTVRSACKSLPISATPSTVVWLTDRMTDGVISWMIRLINSLCGNFPLVVSVSATFIFFPSLL